jgi:hypothetical protein
MKVIDKKHHYLYKTVNLITGQEYIGARSTDSTIESDSYLGSGKYLLRSVKKYGRCNFTKVILEIFENSKSLYEAERAAVSREYVDLPNTFNIKVGGYGGGSKRTTETRSKMSISRTGVKHSEGHVRKIAEANRGKISWNKGGTISLETREKISKSKKGKPGRFQTDESRAKISATMKTKSQTTVTCPHCSKEGNVINMRAWHFNNCKLKQ